ncbi:MAG: DNA-3-methyladenine glycosylase [Eubacteriales bacterium]|nr:DNA-3-methyladenine glycosylase [Eubacteriales bacterium]
MKNKILPKEYYCQPATRLACDLVGKMLCVRCGDRIVKRLITETECYYGSEDTACHASRGKTARTKILYEEGGLAYIYLCYGIHALLNVVTGKKDHPEAVLIRGIEGAYGPGKLTKELGITVALNGISLTESDLLWIENNNFKTKSIASPRIGISYAAEQDRNRLWRYTIEKTQI